MKLSIVIPVYNEKNTVLEILRKINSVDLVNISKEIIIVDDFSTDGTRDILRNLENDYKIIYHSQNKGKGVSLRTGFKNVTGDIIIIQDADLEYDPNDYNKLIKPILGKKTDVVYGSRFLNRSMKELLKHFDWDILHYFGNIILTTLTKLLYGCNISDMETCYKVFKREVLNDLKLKAKRFDFEPEITAKILKKNYRILEVPVSYNPRSFNEGKKIKVVDGLKALYYLLKYRFLD